MVKKQKKKKPQQPMSQHEETIDLLRTKGWKAAVEARQEGYRVQHALNQVDPARAKPIWWVQCHDSCCRNVGVPFRLAVVNGFILYLGKLVIGVMMEDYIEGFSVLGLVRAAVGCCFLLLVAALFAQTGLRLWESYSTGVDYLETSGRAKKRKAGVSDVYSPIPAIARMERMTDAKLAKNGFLPFAEQNFATAPVLEDSRQMHAQQEKTAREQEDIVRRRSRKRPGKLGRQHARAAEWKAKHDDGEEKLTMLRDGRMITKEVAEEVLLQMGPEKVAEFRAKLEASANK